MKGINCMVAFVAMGTRTHQEKTFTDPLEDGAVHQLRKTQKIGKTVPVPSPLLIKFFRHTFLPSTPNPLSRALSPKATRPIITNVQINIFQILPIE